MLNQPFTNSEMPRPRGVPTDWDEIKERHNIIIGPTAWAGLEAIAQELGFKSRSDLLEAIGRRVVKVVPPDNAADQE